METTSEQERATSLLKANPHYNCSGEPLDLKGFSWLEAKATQIILHVYRMAQESVVRGPDEGVVEPIAKGAENKGGRQPSHARTAPHSHIPLVEATPHRRIVQVEAI